MIKLLGKENDLYTESGRITKSRYIVLVISTIFGLACFLTGREIYGRILKNKAD
ncbi:MAG: hypothetical protein IKK66_03590 [Ruminococcus sp.]|nr:hypothetical protein [Ruminococcus sp.]